MIEDEIEGAGGEVELVHGGYEEATGGGDAFAVGHTGDGAVGPNPASP